MDEVREVVYRRDGYRKNWIKVCESHNPERVNREVLNDLFLKYVCKSKSITRIVKRYSNTGLNHITVYYSNGVKAEYWF